MKTNLLFLVALFFVFSSCEQEQELAVVHFENLEPFPQKIIATRLSEDRIAQVDTFNLDSPGNTSISLKIERPQYVYIQRNSKNSRIFLTPGADLTIRQENDRLTFEGDLKGENTYLEESQNNAQIKELGWDYNAPFDTFRKQAAAHFDYRDKLLDTYVADTTSYFYRLNTIDNRAFKNSAILDYVLTRTPAAKKDSLFQLYIDKDLFDFKKLEAYIEASYLLSFYERKGFEYFGRETYGARFDSVRNASEYYVLTSDLIAEHIPPPFKSAILYQNLQYYPEEFDYVPDSLSAKFTTPRKLVDRYQKDLNKAAYDELIDKIARNDSHKLRYAEGSDVPDFKLQNVEQQEISLRDVYSDKSVLIDVWASWCGPCIRSFPKIRELQEQYKDEVSVISLSIDQTFDLYQKGLSTHEVPGTFKLYADEGFSSTFATHFNIVSIPRYILLSAEGKVIDATLSLVDVEEKLKTEFSNTKS